MTEKTSSEARNPNVNEKKRFRFSLRALFYITLMTIGLTLLLTGRNYIGLAVVFGSLVLADTIESTSPENSFWTKNLAEIGILLGLFYLSVSCYQWFWNDRLSHDWYSGALLLPLSLVVWIREKLRVARKISLC
jgi:hypothetical protein